MPAPVELLRIPANGIEVNVAVSGSGPALLLLHGFPHTWRLWSAVIGPLAERHRVIAPDLRGLGDSTRAAGGYDGENLATDAEQLLAALDVDTAAVVGIDAGVAPAFLLAMRRPDLVHCLVLMESMLGRLPGAEDFLSAGPPWWFGFHAVPGLAEQVLAGHEPEYVDWFLAAGTQGRGVPADVRDAFVAAYTGTESLRCAFEHYRAMPTTAGQIAAATAAGRLTVPTLAIGAQPVGSALYQQLRPIAGDANDAANDAANDVTGHADDAIDATGHLTGHLIAECGHIIPLDRPEALLALLSEFL